MDDGEKWDKFCSRLKPDIRLEVMKSMVTKFEEVAKIALRVGCAIYNSINYNRGMFIQPQMYDLAPMEIGNIQGQTRKFYHPRKQDEYWNNAWFKFHKVRCRPWNNEMKASYNNENFGKDESADENFPEEHGQSDSEN